MYKVKEPIVWRRKQDLLVVLDTQSGFYYTLNKSAQLLWLSMFEEENPLEDAVEYISKSFKNTPDLNQILADCKKLVSEWIDNNLIEEM